MQAKSSAETRTLVETLGLKPAELAIFNNFVGDWATFAYLRQELQAGRFPLARNHLLAQHLAPIDFADLSVLPPLGSVLANELTALGEAALAAGQVGVVILNGGMATRFGGVVKGTVTVLPHKSFLALKLEDIARQPAAAKIRVFLLNSFATKQATLAHLGELRRDTASSRLILEELAHLHDLEQNIALRLTPTGEIFRLQGEVSFYAPGHGDLIAALLRSPDFQAFKKAGGKYLVVSNVDNLGATLSPLILGAHIQSKQVVTVEVVKRLLGDTGGAPMWVDKQMIIVEGFRLSKEQQKIQSPVFNTNTFVLNVEAIRDYPFNWYRSDKVVAGKPVVQFERLLGEITSFVSANYLLVPRLLPGAAMASPSLAPASRFLPVKVPEDLEKLRPLISEMFKPRA